ncbi:MAG: hypothetical protein K9L74_01370 [Candidatus Izimaplasma sp.]|nr:hypothetical protein [Candidatus Izimaplasma bacterium]
MGKKNDDQEKESKKTDKKLNKEDREKKDEKKQKQVNDLKKLIKEMQEKKSKKKPKKKKGLIMIEFGAVFHHNKIINFLFNLILNFTLAYLVIEVFKFAEYREIMFFALVILFYTFIEELFKSYIFIRHFKLIFRSFGTIFYFGYVMIFYLIDKYVFIDKFNFINETLLVFFVLIFTGIRYFLGMGIRRYLRHKK